MGISYYTLQYENRMLHNVSLRYDNLKLCELGNQIIRYNNISAKLHYIEKGVKHISIDINGKDGALVFNLNNKLPFIFHKQFDLITNYGTIEHIENQQQIINNIYDMCKCEGYVIHALPLYREWGNHGYYSYTPNFIYEVAYGKYSIIDMHIHDKLIYCFLQKI